LPVFFNLEKSLDKKATLSLKKTLYICGMRDYEEKIAELLLQSKAIIIEPTNPFTWASGWISPIYCDNRRILSYPDIRSYLKSQFVKIIKDNFKQIDVIAGVATGAIAIAALVADELNLPLVYVRAAAKKHGLGNKIEGKIDKNNKVVVIEDLISTGGSSLNAVQTLRNSKANVMGMVAIFTYGFDISVNNFINANCKLITLCNYNIVIKKAIKNNYIKQNQFDILENWRKDPKNWNSRINNI